MKPPNPLPDRPIHHRQLSPFCGPRYRTNNQDLRKIRISCHDTAPYQTLKKQDHGVLKSHGFRTTDPTHPFLANLPDDRLRS